jgi:hypothetical protein
MRAAATLRRVAPGRPSGRPQPQAQRRAARRGLGRVRAWARRLRWAAVALAITACGARTDLSDDDGEAGDESGTGGGGHGSVSPMGACHRCDGSVVCTHCYVQAYATTYRCAPTAPSPGACLNLGEIHVDQYGAAYTCYYCP